MDYALVLLFGLLTVGLMIKNHIFPTGQNDNINNEVDEIESVDWGNGKI